MDRRPARLVLLRPTTAHPRSWSGPVDRRYHELEDLRRSLAIAPPGSAGLDREDAMRLVAELQDQMARLRRLRDRLAAVVTEDQ